MHLGRTEDLIGVDDVAARFERVRRGYDPEAVDAHLARIRAGVQQLRDHIDDREDESLDLVLRATRRSIEEALADARARASAIVADAEVAAQKCANTAEERAAERLAEAQAQARHQDETARERYAEIGRLLEVRRKELEALDARIAQRRESLFTIAAQLEALATDLSGERVDLAAPIDPVGPIDPVAPVDVVAPIDLGTERRFEFPREAVSDA